ncbi:MAG: hypothetical protein ACREIF_05615 [Chthoniobacterales bacterium]
MRWLLVLVEKQYLLSDPLLIDLKQPLNMVALNAELEDFRLG